MADEVLSALVTGDEQISSVLRDVQDELEDTADAARDAAAGMAGAAASFNAAEEAADDLQDTLGDISGVAAAAGGALEGTEESTDELRSAAISGAGALQGYQAALDNVPEAAIEAAAANRAVASSADEAGDEFRSAARAVEDYRDELATAGAISLAVPDVADRTATIQRRVTTTVDTEGTAESTVALASVREAATAIPDSRTVSVDIDTDTDALETQIATDTSELQDIDLPERQYTIGADVETSELAAFSDQLGALPSKHTTEIEIEGSADALTEIGAVNTAIQGLPETRHITAEVDADVDTADIGAEAFAGLGDTFEDTTVESHALSEGLDSTAAGSAHAAAEAAGATAELDALGETSRSTTADVDGLGGALSALGDISAAPDIDAVTPTVQTEEARENFDEFSEAINALPGDVRIDASITGTDEFAEDLETAQRRTRGAYESLQQLQDSGVDVRGMVGAADGLDDLRDKLDDAGGEAATTARRLDSLSGSARDMTDSAIAGSAGLADLETATDDISRNALTASSALSEMGDETSDLAGDAITTASSMQFLAGRTDEAGDEMLEAAASAGVLQGSLMALTGAGAVGGVDDMNASIGGLTGSIGTMAKVITAALPMIGSLGTALGGLAVGGLGVGAGLGGMVGAGLYGLGEQVANRDPTDDIKTSAEGVQEIMANLKEQIGTIFEPLTNNPVFQNMARGALSEVLQIASEFVVYVQRLAPALGGMADRLGAVFDAVRPQLWAELEATTRALLPAVEALISGTLQALPGIMATMRKEGLAVIPMLADFTKELIPLIGPTIRLGTALLSVTLPALSWLMKVMGPLMPIVSALADGIIMASQAFGEFYDAFSPIIDLLGTVAIGAVAVAAGLSAISSVISGALAIGKLVGTFVSLSSIIGVVTSSLGAIASVVTTVGSAIAGAVLALNPLTLGLIALGAVAIGIAAHFGYLDGVMSGLKDTWDLIVGAITGDSGAVKQAIAAIGNGAIDMLNGLIKQVNKLPGLEFNKLDQIQVPKDQQGGGKGGKKGGKSPWLSLGGDGKKAGLGRGKSGGGAKSQKTTPQAQPYQKEEVTVNIYGDNQNEARMKQLAKEAVREANRESRRRRGAGN